MPATKAFASAIALRMVNPTATVLSTGSYTDLLNKPTTADIVEHTNALYFTNARARAAIGTSGDLSYNSSTGVLSYTTPTTSGITEGSNLYFTNARARTAISVTGNLSYNSTTGVLSYSTPTTSSVTEGTNLYYTDSRARSAISVTGNLSYNSTTGILSYSTPTTSSVTEGTNLYYTDSRARSAISFTAGSGGYNNTTGVITIPTNTNQLTNGAGFISGITSSNVTTALGFTPESTSNRGVANGYATLDGTGKVPSAQLPSYVDDVLEYTTLATFPLTGTSGIIYVTQDTNKTYRWTGSAYVEISPSPGTTDSLTEGTTNKYYTDTRVRSAISFTAGSGAYNSATGVITIPTNTNQLTNGAGFITSNQTITVTGDATGVGSTSISLTLTNSGATSGTYGGASSVPVITVDAKGRITSISTTAVSAAVTLTSTQITTALGYIPVTPTELEDVRALALAGL